MASSLLHLSARDLVKSYGDRPVLDGVDLAAHPGRPLALVGENGVGKSTLMRLLAGIEQPDAGSVSRPADVGHLAQDSELAAGATVGSVLRDALAPLHDLVARLESLAGRLTDPDAVDVTGPAYDEALAEADLHGAWDADARAERAGARLGLAGLDRSRPVSSLSGGQRSRLALAALLTRQPTCLLLDEPTNHLDDSAVAFVVETVRAMPGVVVMASHDRAFLDEAAAEILDLDPAFLGADGQGGGRYSGGYSEYLDARRASRQRWEEAFTAWQAERDALRRTAATTARQVAHNRAPRDNDRFIHHFKGGNVARTVSRRVRDAERRLEVLDRDPVPRPPTPLSFSGALTGDGRTGRVVQVRDLEVAGRLRVEGLDVAAGEHVLVTGPNGSGKSSMLAVLAGQLPATRGSVDVTARTVGHLPQEVCFRHPEVPAARLYRGLAPDGPPLPLLGLLAAREAHRPVGVLSAGQQRRLALAVLVARQPDLLLLDEPTNHISPALAEELEEAMERSPGTVVVTSHDRWLRSRWDGPVLELTGVRG